VPYVIAVVLALVGGVIGALPAVLSQRVVRRLVAKGGQPTIIPGLLATFLSFLLMAVEIIVCFLLASSYLLVFALTAIFVFLAVVIVYTALLVRH
jgi:hypothetical protein